MSKISNAEFRVIPNGPLRVSGIFVVKDENGNIIPTSNEIFLCRCGGSGLKPFCDGSHQKIGVRD
jgi:CDGSH-type Zn-finger protein